MSPLNKSKASAAALESARGRIYDELAQLPHGTLKKREIYGKTYYYLQHREGKKVIHKYVGKEIPRDLAKNMQRRQDLKSELAKIQDALMSFWAQEIRGIR